MSIAEILALAKIATKTNNSSGSDGNVDLSITRATAGQTVRIAEVDENGVPTAWEPADFPSGGKWELVCDVTFEEEISSLSINFDKKYNELFVYFKGTSVVATGDYAKMNFGTKVNNTTYWFMYGNMNAYADQGHYLSHVAVTPGYMYRSAWAGQWVPYSDATDIIDFVEQDYIDNLCAELFNQTFAIGGRVIVMGVRV